MAVTNVPYANTTAMGVYLANGPAPSGGAVFTLQIKPGELDLITFPPTITILEGYQDQDFDVTWAEEGDTILQAQLTEYGGSPISGIVFEKNITCIAPSPGGAGGLISAEASVAGQISVSASVDIGQISVEVEI